MKVFLSFVPVRSLDSCTYTSATQRPESGRTWGAEIRQIPNVFSDIDFEGTLVTEEQIAEQEVHIPDTRAPESPSDIIYTSNQQARVDPAEASSRDCEATEIPPYEKVFV